MISFLHKSFHTDTFSYALFFLIALSSTVQAKTLQVGPGREHIAACAAIQAAAPGDVIEIFASEKIANTCAWDTPGLVISGVGNPVITVAAGASVLEVFADRTLVQNVTVKGGRCQDGACAGITAHAGNLTLRNVRIFGSNVGLKTHDDIAGTIWVDSSQFADNDTNIHAGSVERLRLTNSYLHDAAADLVFTQALTNEMSGNRFSSLESATTKRQLVLAGSKRSFLIGNVFFKGGQSTDTAMIQSVDTGEGAGEIQLFNNTLVSHYAPGAIFLEAIGETAPKVEARRNVIWGNGRVTSLNVRADLEENYTGIGPVFADENFRVAQGTIQAGWGAALDATSFPFAAREEPTQSSKGDVVLLAAGGPGPASVTLNCGASIAGILHVFNNTVTLSGPAPTGGVAVTVTSSNTTVAPMVVSSFTIAAGQTTGAFAFRTTLTTVGTPVSFTATANGVSKTSAAVVIGPASLSSLVLETPTMAGGFTTTSNKLTLTGPAPTTGITMKLSTTNPKAQVPATVFFPAGFSSQVFPITAQAVTSTYNGTVTATHSSGSRTANLTVAPLAVNALQAVTNPILAGGAYAIIKVLLTGTAPTGGTNVALASSNSTVAPVPSTVTVGAGRTYVTFYVLTRAVSAVTPVTITATLFGQTKSIGLTLNPIQLYLISTLPPTVKKGLTTVLYVVLDGVAPTGGKTVTLSSGNPALAPVPAQVIVPAGAQSTTVSIRAGTVTAPITITLQATSGSVTKPTTLKIIP